MDCDIITLKELWAVANEKVWGHGEYYICNQIAAHYTFFSKRKPQLPISSVYRQQ